MSQRVSGGALKLKLKVIGNIDLQRALYMDFQDRAKMGRARRESDAGYDELSTAVEIKNFVFHKYPRARNFSSFKEDAHLTSLWQPSEALR